MGIKRSYIAIIILAAITACLAGKSTDSIVVTGGANLNRVYADSLRAGNFAGGNYTEFEADGTVKFNGDATVWEDANIGAASLPGGTSAPDLDVALDGTTIYQPVFNGSATMEQLFASIEIPHATKLNDSIYPHVHWTPTSASAGDVTWIIKYAMCTDSNTITGEDSLVVTTAAGGTAWRRKTTPFRGVYCNHLGTQFMFRFYREPTRTTDTYPDDAMVFTIGIHYKKDTEGSRLITTK